MKALKFSFLGLFTLLFFACTKEGGSLTADESALAVSSQRANNNNVQSNGTPKPLLTASQSPAPAAVGIPVTVSYTAKDPTTNAIINCGRVTIYQWDGNVWNEVATTLAPTTSYTFTPTTATACAYKFRAGFAPGAGSSGENCVGSYAGVDFTTEADFCVNLSQACVENFTIGSNVSAVNLFNGLYEFTITYTLTSPQDVNNVKFQGGATAGGNSGHAITNLGNTVVVNANNNNTVMKWEGNLVACQPQIVTFSYTRNFSCPATNAEVTGQWSAKSGEIELGIIAPLMYSCQ